MAVLKDGQEAPRPGKGGAGCRRMARPDDAMEPAQQEGGVARRCSMGGACGTADALKSNRQSASHALHQQTGPLNGGLMRQRRRGIVSDQRFNQDAISHMQALQEPKRCDIFVCLMEIALPRVFLLSPWLQRRLRLLNVGLYNQTRNNLGGLS